MDKDILNSDKILKLIGENEYNLYTSSGNKSDLEKRVMKRSEMFFTCFFMYQYKAEFIDDEWKNDY